MPAKRPDEADFTETAALVTNAVDAYRVHLPLDVRKRWRERDLAGTVGLAASRLSEIKSGKWLPSLPEIWRLCQELGIPIERFIQAAAKHRPNDYPDIAALIRVVESDTSHQPKEHAYILDCLRFSLSSEAKKLRWDKSTYKQMADLILCFEFDAYSKAKFYADVVWDWRDAKNRDLARLDRKTDEMAIVAS